MKGQNDRGDCLSLLNALGENKETVNGLIDGAIPILSPYSQSPSIEGPTGFDPGDKCLLRVPLLIVLES